MELFEKQVRFNTLIVLWIDKICFAKPHFKVSFLNKCKMNLHGFVADQYRLFDLAHNPIDEYLSEFDWWKSRYINGKYRFVLNNKLVCNDLLAPYIKVPKTYAISLKREITDVSGKKLSLNDLLALIKEKQKLFLRPIEAGKGKNVFLITYSDGVFCVNRTKKTAEDVIALFDSFTNWFVSECITQADYLNKIYSETTNTIRLITIRRNGKVCIPIAVQRIGTKKTVPVDNGSRGGIVAKIDLESGALSIAKPMHQLGEFPIHPDSKSQIEGFVIPNFEDIKNKITEVADKFPYLKFIAWDILVTDEGPCIIEANASSGINILQLWGGQRNKLLGDFYRENGII